MSKIKQFPHCDSRVLHKPGECDYCDAHPGWQELRQAWGINFTGEDKEGLPCPAETVRTLDTINKWGGNRPKKKTDAEKDDEWLNKQFAPDEVEAIKKEKRGKLAKLIDKITPENLPWTKTTLSGKEPDLKYYEENGGAPQPINPKTGQHEDYWIISAEDRKKGFVRPVRKSYKHEACGAITTMGQAIAETYAANPKFYGATFCATCGAHYPVGENGEFIWNDGSGEKVGS